MQHIDVYDPRAIRRQRSDECHSTSSSAQQDEHKQRRADVPGCRLKPWEFRFVLCACDETELNFQLWKLSEIKGEIEASSTPTHFICYLAFPGAGQLLQPPSPAPLRGCGGDRPPTKA